MSFEGWREVKLEDLVDSISKKHLFNKDKVIFLNTSDVYDGKVLNHEYTSVKELPGQAKKSIQKGDILFSEIRPINRRFAFIDFDAEDYVVSTKLMVLRAKEEIEPKFLYYYLSSNDTLNTLQTLAESRSGTFPQITFNEVKSLKIKLPTRREQQYVVQVIESIDNKIELNSQINKTLEEMAQAIFKSWFVDFEPFRDGEFVESELGMIPKGWKVVQLKDVVDIFDSKRIPLSKKEREERKGEFPYYGATGVIDYVDNYIFDGVYVLVGEDGSVIDDNDNPFVQYVWGKFWVNNHAHVLKGKNFISDELLYLFLKKVNVRPYVTGAVQLKLSQSNLKRIPFILPPKYICGEINQKLNAIFQFIKKNKEENIILLNLRDTLLPKLMSGEIRVPLD